MGIYDKIHDNKIIIASKEQDQLLSSFYSILGTTQILNGEQLVYDFYQKIFRGGILPLELATGGGTDELIPDGKCNWYPGSVTYGYVLEQDAPVYDNEDGKISPDHILTTVYKKDDYHTYEESSVKILTVLDAVNTNPKWQEKCNISYKVVTHDGISGYMYSKLKNKIVYKDC